MSFQPRLPNDTATLLLLAIFIIVLLGLSNSAGDRASEHATEISVIGADPAARVVRPVALDVPARGRGRAPCGAPARGEPEPIRRGRADPRRRARGDIRLRVAGPLDRPRGRHLGISRAFTGLVIVAIAGNAVENAVAVTSAAKGENDLSVSVVKNAVSQTAVVVFPLLVLLSLFFAEPLRSCSTRSTSERCS